MEIAPFIVRLEQQLQTIEQQVIELLAASTLKKRYKDPSSLVVIIGYDYFWDTADEKQKHSQLKLLRKYSSWFEHLQMIFYDSPEATQKQIRDTDKRIRTLIEKRNDPFIPSTINEAKRIFREQIQIFYTLLQVFKTSDQVEIILVPDTNALIKAPDVASYGAAIGQADYTVVILPTVLSELDKLKITHRSEEFRGKVESVIRRLKGLRQQGNIHEGVTVNRVVTVKMIAQEPDFKKTLSWLDPQNNDDRIIAATLEVQREEPSSIVVLVTNDINHQNKAEMANLPFIEPPDTPTSSS